MARMAVKNLVQRRTMTALALVGLVLGVATVVTLVSISTGVQNLVTESTSELRGIMVMEKDTAFGPMLSVVEMSDLRTIEGMSGIRNVCPRVMHLPKSIDGKFIEASGFEGFSGTIVGVDPAREARKRIGPLPVSGSIVRGRALQPSDGKAVVIGRKVADDLKKTVGSTIKIDDERFRVVGIYETGNAQTEGQMVVPISEARRLAGLSSDRARAAFVELDDTNQLARMAKMIEMRISGVRAISTEQFGEMLSGLISNIESFLWAMSLIAAIVAGLNIVNTMLMSIMDREQEIGVMRSLGWTRGDIMKLLVVESAIMGIVGGLLGVLVGAAAVEIIKSILGIPMLVDSVLALEAILFGLGVGTLGGIYPAWRASMLNPLEAIKGE